MSSAKWRLFCLGLNVLSAECFMEAWVIVGFSSFNWIKETPNVFGDVCYSHVLWVSKFDSLKKFLYTCKFMALIYSHLRFISSQQNMLQKGTWLAICVTDHIKRKEKQELLQITNGL